MHVPGVHHKSPPVGTPRIHGLTGRRYDKAVIESFSGRMQTELLDRRRWRTRVELANAMLEHLEIFQNRQRRHSALGTLTPTDYELAHHQSLA